MFTIVLVSYTPYAWMLDVLSAGAIGDWLAIQVPEVDSQVRFFLKPCLLPGNSTMSCVLISLETLERFLAYLGFEVRVTSVDGHALMVHHDLRRYRCNVDVWTGKNLSNEPEMYNQDHRLIFRLIPALPPAFLWSGRYLNQTQYLVPLRLN
jgi:hypothetical protein